MKKFISLFLVFVISTVLALPSFAAKSIKFTVSDSEVFAGDEFTVDIFISDYSQLKSATLLVEYDKNAMQFLDLNVGPIVTAGSDAVSFKDVQNSSKSYIQIDYNDSSASLSTAGKFVSITFVASDTAVGEKDIMLSVSGNKAISKTGTVTPEFDNGKINIINNNPVNDSTTEPPSEESLSSDVPTVSENTENVQNTSQNVTENSTKNIDENSSADKNDEESQKRIIIGSVVTAIIVIAAIFFETKCNKGKHKKNKSKKRKTRR